MDLNKKYHFEDEKKNVNISINHYHNGEVARGDSMDIMNRMLQVMMFTEMMKMPQLNFNNNNEEQVAIEDKRVKNFDLEPSNVIEAEYHIEDDFDTGEIYSKLKNINENNLKEGLPIIGKVFQWENNVGENKKEYTLAFEIFNSKIKEEKDLLDKEKLEECKKSVFDTALKVDIFNSAECRPIQMSFMGGNYSGNPNVYYPDNKKIVDAVLETRDGEENIFDFIMRLIKNYSNSNYIIIKEELMHKLNLPVEMLLNSNYLFDYDFDLGYIKIDIVDSSSHKIKVKFTAIRIEDKVDTSKEVYVEP